MSAFLRRAAVLLLGAAVVMGLSTLTVPTASAAPAPYCQCVGYVQNYIGHINTYYAKDAGPALKRMGYRESMTPMGVGDIVVLQPGSVPGVAAAGHIAFLASYSVRGTSVSVVLRGANQGNNGWLTDRNCRNVNRWPFSYGQNRGVRYYRR